MQEAKDIVDKLILFAICLLAAVTTIMLL